MVYDHKLSIPIAGIPVSQKYSSRSQYQPFYSHCGNSTLTAHAPVSDVLYNAFYSHCGNSSNCDNSVIPSTVVNFLFPLREFWEPRGRPWGEAQASFLFPLREFKICHAQEKQRQRQYCFLFPLREFKAIWKEIDRDDYAIFLFPLREFVRYFMTCEGRSLDSALSIPIAGIHWDRRAVGIEYSILSIPIAGIPPLFFQFEYLLQGTSFYSHCGNSLETTRSTTT